MGAAIPLREDFDAAKLRGLAQRSRDGAQNRRLLALEVTYDGHRRSDAARFAGVGLQIIRDWVLRFNAESPDGLKDRKASGPPRKLHEEQRRALATIVESGPDPAIHGVVRWRRCDLAAWLQEQFGVSLAETAVGAGAAPDGLCQALRAPAPLCPGRSCAGGVQKNFPERLKEIRAGLGFVAAPATAQDRVSEAHVLPHQAERLGGVFSGDPLHDGRTVKFELVEEIPALLRVESRAQPPDGLQPHPKAGGSNRALK